MMLLGSEVKSLRGGRASIAEAYASEKDGELFLINAYIPEYAAANRFNHAPNRPRKLLLHKSEVEKLQGRINREGMTLVPLSIYFNARGIAKCQLGVAKGKRQPTSARPTRSATGSAKRRGCCARATARLAVCNAGARACFGVPDCRACLRRLPADRPGARLDAVRPGGSGPGILRDPAAARDAERCAGLPAKSLPGESRHRSRRSSP